MSNDKKEVSVDPNEIQQEETFKSKVERTPDEIRRIYVDEYGVPEDEEFLAKIVERECAKNKQLSTAIAQKIGWREKALSEKSETQGAENNKQEGDGKNAAAQDELTTEALLNLQADNYSPSEIKEIYNEAKKLNITIDKFMGSELLMKGFKAQREEVKTQKATPSPSTRFFQKVKPEERQTEFEKVKEGIRNKQR